MQRPSAPYSAPTREWPSGPAWPVVVAAAGAAALAARIAGPSAALAAVLVAGVAVAAAAPQIVALALLLAILFQDWLVAAGWPLAQQADEALLAVGLLGLLVRSTVTGRLLRTPLDAPIVALVAVAAVSALAGDVPPAVAALGLLAILKGPLAFELFARSPTTPAGVRFACRVLLAAVAVLALVAVAQRLGGEAAYALTGRLAYYLEWQGGKAPSLFTNHNALGHVCVLGGALAVGLAHGAPAASRRLYVLAGAACLAGLVVSASRESWIAAALGLVVGAWAVRSRTLFLTALAVTVVLIAGAIAVYFGSPLLREEIARRSAGVVEGWHLYRMGFDDWAYRGEYRVYVILKSWEVFKDNAWLGAGPGRFGGQVAMVTASPLYQRYAFLPLRGEYHPLDVFWSRLLAEFGILGSAAYIWAWAGAGLVFLRGSRSGTPASTDGSLGRGLAVGGLMAWTAAAVIAVFAPALEDPLVAVPVFAWAGAVWALSRRGPEPGATRHAAGDERHAGAGPSARADPPEP